MNHWQACNPDVDYWTYWDDRTVVAEEERLDDEEARVADDDRKAERT